MAILRSIEDAGKSYATYFSRIYLVAVRLLNIYERVFIQWV